MSSFSQSRIFQIISVICLVALGSFIWGFVSAKSKIFPYEFIERNFSQREQRLEKKPPIRLHRQEKVNLYGYTGFKREDVNFVDSGYLLISRFSLTHDQVILELVRLRDFVVIHTWIPPVREILKRTNRIGDTIALEAYRAQHPLLLENREIVFHSGEGPLVRIDQESKIVWVVQNHFHHSIELSHDGHLIVPIVNEPSPVDIKLKYRDDGYAVITQKGEILKQYSLGKIFFENDLEALFLGVGIFDKDPFHLNDAQPIFQNIGEAKIGDVALSICHLSTVALFRPSTGKIIWSKMGPWLNQHDINPLGDGSYSVFGNDMVRVASKACAPGSCVSFNDISNVYIYTPPQKINTPYSDIMKQMGVYSATQSRSRILSNGDVYIESTDQCRLLRLSTKQARWTYVSGSSAEKAGALHWSRYISSDEFDRLEGTGNVHPLQV